MIRFEPRTRSSLALRLGAQLGAVAAALLLAAIPLGVAGAPLIRAFGLMADGAAGSLFALTETLTRATPLIFTGLAAAVAFRAKLYNIGAEGQLYAGALAAVAIGAGAIEAPPYLLVPLIMAAGALAGAMLMLVPTLLRTRLGVDEVVTTLLLNFVVLLFVQMMLEGPLKDPMGGGWPQSAPILPEGTLAAAVRAHAAACRLHRRADRRRAGLRAGRPHGARARDPRRRRERARGALCRHLGDARDGDRGRALRRARGARRRQRGRGAEGLSHRRHVARLRLCGHRGRDDRGPRCARGRAGRDLHRRAFSSAPTRWAARSACPITSPT